jgi:hypothetical protein
MKWPCSPDIDKKNDLSVHAIPTNHNQTILVDTAFIHELVAPPGALWLLDLAIDESDLLSGAHASLRYSQLRL